MATAPLSQLNGGVALTTPAAGDYLAITDSSDTTESPDGTTKPIDYADLVKAMSPAFETLTDGATITWAFGGDRVRNAVVTLGGNRTLSITGAVSGSTGVLIVKQDGTGSRTLTLPGSSKVVGGGAGAVTLTTTASAVDILSFYYDGTNFWWTYGKNFT